MDWIKLDAKLAANEKADQLSDGAFRSMVHIWCHAALHETGGRVPAGAVRLIPRVTARHLRELEGAGLIHANGSGWLIHEWDQHQAAAQAIEDKKRRDRARKRKTQEDTDDA